MKNIIKTLGVMLASISLLAVSAKAGELAVSGTAKATYNIYHGNATGKGLGVTNELNFTASGEMDNGYTWTYSMELDPTDAAASTANNDDTQINLTTPYGKFGIMILEGGLDAEDAASQSAYSRPTDSGDPSATVDNYSIDSYNNVMYTSPADLLPLGTVIKLAYAPDLDTTQNSGNAAGANQVEGTSTYVGRSMTATRIDMTPIDGLTIGASYNEMDKSGAAKMNQTAESGAYYGVYTIGNLSVGYSKAMRADMVADGSLSSTTEVESYDQSNMSAAFAFNDDLTISYEVEKSSKTFQLDSVADIEQKSTGIQLAYNLGGATFAMSRNTHDNVGYSTATDGRDIDQTLFALTLAF